MRGGCCGTPPSPGPPLGTVGPLPWVLRPPLWMLWNLRVCRRLRKEHVVSGSQPDSACNSNLTHRSRTWTIILIEPNFRSDFAFKFIVNFKFKFECELHQGRFSDVVFASFRCWWWLLLPPLLVVMTALPSSVGGDPCSLSVVAVGLAPSGGWWLSRWLLPYLSLLD